MKKGILILSALILTLFIMSGCYKDPLYLGNAGLLRLELKKGYTTQDKGAVESFFATVKVVYADGEVSYNCKFTDQNNTGLYSNDQSEGDKIYVRKDVEFRIVIETEIDGYFVSGESEPMMYSENVEILNVQIVLRSGTTRIAIYAPNADEIFGNYVVAYGEILENVGNRPIHEAGIMCVAKSVYDTYGSPDAFSFDNESASDNWIVEYYYSGEDQENEEITRFSVVLRGLQPNTSYCMRAFTFSESDSALNYCYSRVVEFTTNNDIAHDISVVTNEVDNVTIESVDVAGRVLLLDGNSADNIAELGFIFDTYNNYVANSSTLDYYRNNSFLYPASERSTVDDMIVFSANVSDLQEGMTYVFRAYATFNDQPYYGSVKMFAMPQNPENIRIQADATDATLTGAYVDLQGNIISDAGYDFAEVGFVYGFFDRGETATSISDLTERATASMMSGRFASRINLPIVNKTMYYAAYAITTTGYEAYGELSSAVSIEPANVPSVTLTQDNLSEYTTHSMTIMCNVDTNGRSDCECGIVYTSDASNTATYDTIRRTLSANGTEEFVVSGLRKGTEYTYWAYIKVVDEYITTEQYSATTMQEGDFGPGGGIIFYADDTNGFALEYYIQESTSPDAESGDTAIWGSTSGIALNTDSPSSITVSGRTNTEAIVSYHNSIGFEFEYAALKCYQSTQGGKNDWYLPTSVEMQAIINYNPDVYASAGGFWTSDEQNAENAVAIIQTESQGVSKGTSLNYVMIRRF